MSRDYSRRDLFRFWRKSDRASEPAAPKKSAERIWLRPPGAVAEDVFADTCQRCGKCIQVCPREAILPLPPDAGKNAGTPFILARRAPCVVCNGLQCTTVCPSGALKPIALEDIDMGTAVVIESTCVAFHGQPCEVCHQACPVPGALRLEWYQPVVDADKCIGCGLCENMCPTAPTSIVVAPRLT